MLHSLNPIGRFFLVSLIFLIPAFSQAQVKPPEMILKSYQVADLVIPMQLHHQNDSNPVGSDASLKNATSGCKESTGTREKELINLITQSIAPKTWKDSGGKGVLFYSPVNMALVVNQLPSVQKQVEDLLKSLRCLQDAKETLQIEKKMETDCCLADFAIIKNLLTCESCSASIKPVCCALKNSECCSEAGKCSAGCSECSNSCENSQVKGECCKECCAGNGAECKGLASCCKVKGSCTKNDSATGQTGNVLYLTTTPCSPCQTMVIGKPIPANPGTICVLVRQGSEKTPGVCPFIAARDTMNVGTTVGCCPATGTVKVCVPGHMESNTCPVAHLTKAKVSTGVSRKNHVLDELCQAYEEACAEGKTKEAAKFARAALSIDPTCFTRKR